MACQIIIGQLIKLEYLITVQEGFSSESVTFDSSYDTQETNILYIKHHVLEKTIFGDRLNHVMFIELKHYNEYSTFKCSLKCYIMKGYKNK